MFRRAFLAAGLVAALFAGRDVAAQESPSADYVYVTNQNEATVSLIDRERMEEVRRVDLQKLGFSANARPHHVVVEPDGSFWYVTLIGDNRVLKLDRQNRLVAQTPFEVAGMLALDPVRDLLFVGRSMTAVNPPSSIGVIRRSTMELLQQVDVFFPRPHALAVDTAGALVYVASLAENQLAAVHPEDEEIELTDLGGPAQTLVQFAISPDGQTLVATGQISGKLLVFDLSEPSQPRLIRELVVEAGPFIPSFSPDGRTLWVPNKEADAVTVVDTETWSVAGVLRGEGLADPDGAVVSPDGRFVFVSNNNSSSGHHGPATTGHGHEPGSVVVIDTSTRQIVKVIPVGHNPTGIGTSSGSRAEKSAR